MDWIKNIWTSSKVKALKQQVRELEAKLEERQEAINKTNAYYKKKLHEVKNKKNADRSL